jgi:hypothetical protein
MADEGDTILLANGVYLGMGNRDVEFLGKAVVVRSENGSGFTIVDCEASPYAHHCGFLFLEGEGPGSVLEGVTIRGGYRENGGGIVCHQSSPTIKDCIISGNVAETFGGGLFLDLEACPTISDCLIFDNSAWAAGAVYCFYDVYATFANCTLVRNTAGTGAGIQSRADPHLMNCLVAFNQVGEGVDGCAHLECCDVYGNDGGDWVDCIAGQAGINGNIWADPLFCDLTNGDFRLYSGSPCLYAPGCTLIGLYGQGCLSSTEVPAAESRSIGWGPLRSLFRMRAKTR